MRALESLKRARQIPVANGLKSPYSNSDPLKTPPKSSWGVSSWGCLLGGTPWMHGDQLISKHWEKFHLRLHYTLDILGYSNWKAATYYHPSHLFAFFVLEVLN